MKIQNTTGKVLGVGCDTEEISRFETLLSRRPSFLKRWYSPQEAQWVINPQSWSPLGTDDSSPDAASSRACLLFCCKEAILKACWNSHPLLPSAIHITRLDHTGPSAFLAHASLNFPHQHQPCSTLTCHVTQEQNSMEAWCLWLATKDYS